MSTVHAQPGDTIEITSLDPDWMGKRLVVIERPNNAIGQTPKGDAWIIFGRHARFFTPCQYKVVHTVENRDRRSELSVDESLAKQRDDNLRSAFV